MTLSQLAIRMAAVISLAFATLMGSGPAIAHDQPAMLVLDILPLKEGKTLADAEDYFDKVEPIFARYGMTRTDAVLDVQAILRGPAKADVVNLWQTPNAQASFDGIFSDEDYAQFTALRDSIFDLQAATIIVTLRKPE